MARVVVGLSAFRISVRDRSGPAGWLRDPPRDMGAAAGETWKFTEDAAEAGVFDRATAVGLLREFAGYWGWRQAKARWATMEELSENGERE